MTDDKNNITENVTFSLFGVKFTLRVHKDQIESLNRGIASVQSACSRVMRENPTLSPQQTAILLALENQLKLQNYLEGSKFDNEALDKVRTIKATLLRNLNGK